MKRTPICEITEDCIGKTLIVSGWIRTIRKASKTMHFVEINDGSKWANFQVVLKSEEVLEKNVCIGASISVEGQVTFSTGTLKQLEINTDKITLLGGSDAVKYPFAKKQHSLEYLREYAHLRPKTKTISAIQRIRNVLAYASHKFFQKKGYLYIQTPIITTSDCEGAGEMFQVTTQMGKLPYLEEDILDYSKDFFKKPAYLTVSGQLNLEPYACSMGNVYTFGPTFRAENSNTTRHLAEFWMVEPEIAFADLEENVEVATQYIKYSISQVLKQCSDELDFLNELTRDKDLKTQLELTVSQEFVHITYTEAVSIVQKHDEVTSIEWGDDLGSEQERFLCETYFKRPVVVRDYPKDLKAFYMRLNDDNKTVAAMDILVPGIGELVGGSQREERMDILLKRIEEMGLDAKNYDFYLDTRRFGTIVHSGFGLGFERLVRYVTRMENIRDVIPYPRWPGHADY